MNRQQSYVPRGMLIFFQIFGTVFALVGLITYILFMSDVSNAIGGGEADINSKALTGLILAMLTYLAWKTLYTAIVIVRFFQNSSDDDISANRFIISALSLNLGGFFTPFVVTMLPNVATRSTINPRWFLTRTMGWTSLVGGVLSLFAYFVSVTTGQFGITNHQLFDLTQTTGIISVVVLTLGLAITLFGILSVALFYQKSSHEIFEKGNTSFATMMNIVAVIWLAILTVELLITMLFAVMRLLGAIMDFFRAMNSDGFGKAMLIFMALINLVLTAAYVGYVLYLTSRAMVGIWVQDGIEYKPYESLLRAQNSRKQKFA